MTKFNTSKFIDFDILGKKALEYSLTFAIVFIVFILSFIGISLIKVQAYSIGFCDGHLMEIVDINLIDRTFTCYSSLFNETQSYMIMRSL